MFLAHRALQQSRFFTIPHGNAPRPINPKEDTSVGAAQPAAPLTLARSVRLLEQGQVTAAEGLVFATHQQRGFELESDMLEAKASFMTAQASVHSRPVLDFERSQCYA